MAIDWTQVNVSLSDPTKGVSTALSGVSNAGTIFGDLRKSILDEQQRAVENADRDRVFNENVRQFGLNYELDRDQFAEQLKQNGITNDLNERKFDRAMAEWDQTYALNVRQQEANEKYQQGVLNNQAARLSMENSRYKKQDEKDQSIADLAKSWHNMYTENTNFNDTLQQQIDPIERAAALIKLSTSNLPETMTIKNAKGKSEIVDTAKYINQSSQAANSIQQAAQNEYNQNVRPSYGSAYEANTALNDYLFSQTGDLRFNTLPNQAALEASLLQSDNETQSKREQANAANHLSAVQSANNNDVVKALTLTVNNPDFTSGDARAYVTVLNNASPKELKAYGKAVAAGGDDLRNDGLYQNLRTAGRLPADVPANVNTTAPKTVEKNSETLTNAVNSGSNINSSKLKGVPTEELIEAHQNLMGKTRADILNNVSQEQYDKEYNQVLNHLVKITYGAGKKYSDLSNTQQESINKQAHTQTQTIFVNLHKRNINTLSNKIQQDVREEASQIRVNQLQNNGQGNPTAQILNF